MTILSTSVDDVRQKIEASFENEIDDAQRQFIHYLNSRAASLVDDLVSGDRDLIDWKNKGRDVSKKEFLENEISFETGRYK